ALLRRTGGLGKRIHRIGLSEGRIAFGGGKRITGDRAGEWAGLHRSRSRLLLGHALPHELLEEWLAIRRRLTEQRRGVWHRSWLTSKWIARNRLPEIGLPAKLRGRVCGLAKLRRRLQSQRRADWRNATRARSGQRHAG